jgi:hypothetical protein
MNTPKAQDFRAQIIALSIDVTMIGSSLMKQSSYLVLLAASSVLLLLGCSSGPSPEQQAREADQQRDAQRQQAEFRKGLPPVANPGQGW